MHTHLGLAHVHVKDPLLSDSLHAWGEITWDVAPDQHWSASRASEASIVLAFDAEPVGVLVPNDYVASYVRGKEGLIGFASVNPTRADAVSLLVQSIEELGLRGLKLGPTYQHFHPHSVECLEPPRGC